MNWIKKILEYLLVFFIIISLNFLIPRLMPGDPFTYLSSDEGDVQESYSEEQIERYKEYYGLDKPIHIQYIEYLKKLTKGDLGLSIHYNEKVINIIINRAKWTIFIVSLALVLSIIVGVLLGSICAFKKDSLLDKFLYFIMTALSEIPSFLIGIFLLFTVAAKSKVIPLSGGMTVFNKFTGIEKVLDILRHAILPVASLFISQVGGFFLLARNSMITVINKDYMTTAVAKGLTNRRIIFVHGLKNSILPIVTKTFLSLAGILSGSILVENVFSYPGLGKLMKDSVLVRDYTLIQGIFLFVSILVLFMNFLSEIVYKKIDPRVE